MEVLHHLADGAELAAAGNFAFVLGDRFRRSFGYGLLQRFQTLTGVVGARLQGIAGENAVIGFGRLLCVLLYQHTLLDLGQLGLPDQIDLLLVGAAQIEERLIRVAVERISVGDGLQARDGGRIAVAQIVEVSDHVFAARQHLLHLQQTLLGLRDERTVGELQDHLAILFFGAQGVGGIAVRLLHLAEVDIGDLHLRLSRFGHVGEEGDEVLVLAFGLGHGGGAALGVPGVADGQLGARYILRIGVGVDERLQAEARDVVLAVLHSIQRAIEEHLVGLLGVDVGDGVGNLLALLFLAAGVLGRASIAFGSGGGLSGDRALRRRAIRRLSGSAVAGLRRRAIGVLRDRTQRR